ncbi:nucleoside phosphorylase [uncultured Propionibacterium sp.]|uniref:nucleoside phosphorylase n=1 Tax=uncultured Propionibacterium sp. TaxID=218066 RepID=UPI0029317F53|nr:nucleoside phosphorylase [uncultured Propionibacterium sp.]
MLHTHELPILERDDDSTDLIGEGEAASIPADLYPSRAVLAFLGEIVDQYARAGRLPVIETLEQIGNHYPVYRGRDGRGDFAILMMPLGAPAAVMNTDMLFRHGVRRAIAVGSCGALEPLAVGELVVPARALRGEGTSFQYVPASRWIDIDPDMRAVIGQAVEAAGYTVNDSPVWTNDAFYRETRSMLSRRRAEGCAIVDMECSAMAASAALRGARFAQLFYTADSLADPENGHDERDWGRGSRGAALRIALDALSRLEA